eukprot:TRINITY_DN4577_c0_g1_i6.p2 TRINITY_DN4577_c0_g1~~TRINITY_DN4577_c0_g1_i6.p2  ORF type:complete len:341 (+),score=115.71 TRINITY_DN4577_c0_g1_i6:233-1255(+)
MSGAEGEEDDWLHKPRSTEPFTCTGFIRSNGILLLIFALTVVYQTKAFGYYAPEAVNQRLREAAEQQFRFGTFERRTTRVAGDGQLVEHGKYVTCHVLGYDALNRNFWNTHIDRKPHTWQVGRGKVIKGIDAAVQEMRVGEKARVTLAPDMAFGERGKGVWGIGPWEVIVFDLEVLSVADEAPEAERKKKPAERMSEREDEDRRHPQREDEDEDDLLQPLTEAAGGPKTPAPAPAEAAATVSDGLRDILVKLAVGRYEKQLASVGLVTVDDLASVESADDLGTDIPAFTRKKIAAHAQKLRAAQAEGAGSEPAEARTDGDGGAKAQAECKTGQTGCEAAK